ncbi:MAG: hypothetical protein EOP50_10395 [Sphingobacteriales bacterium]|nr:MAG: hypothetical protein EOP50_10395 [Sphingobacteriales bacterium]
MNQNGTNPKVDFYFEKEERWQQEIALLRQVMLGTGLREELKWGCPCYLLGDRNIVLIHVFKEYCALLLFKGVLLQDAQGLLVQQTRNVQSARQLRFAGVGEIRERRGLIEAYILEAIEVEKKGLKVPPRDSTTLEFPAEFQTLLESDATLQEAFSALTPGRQRAYHLFFSEPKQSKTRAARVEKYLPQIRAGKGLHDR